MHVTAPDHWDAIMNRKGQHIVVLCSPVSFVFLKYPHQNDWGGLAVPVAEWTGQAPKILAGVICESTLVVHMHM